MVLADNSAEPRTFVYSSNSSVIRNIKDCSEYILSNWEGARLRLARKDHIRGCSAEGHVSHVLSSRMSTLPMGWSRVGADKTARLRCYKLNGGKMIELVRSQPSKEKQKKAAGAENVELATVRQIINSESAGKRKHGIKGKYAEVMVMKVSVSLDTRTKVALYHHFLL